MSLLWNREQNSSNYVEIGKWLCNIKDYLHTQNEMIDFFVKFSVFGRIIVKVVFNKAFVHYGFIKKKVGIRQKKLCQIQPFLKLRHKQKTTKKIWHFFVCRALGVFFLTFSVTCTISAFKPTALDFTFTRTALMIETLPFAIVISWQEFCGWITLKKRKKYKIYNYDDFLFFFSEQYFSVSPWADVLVLVRRRNHPFLCATLKRYI